MSEHHHDAQIDEFASQEGDSPAVSLIKAEIRGALAAFQGCDNMIGECLEMAIENEMHDDLIAGLVALSEDLRSHVVEKIMPLRRSL